ncbi:aldo/keto reductase family oxidoreductase [Geojedonia litorea]|uniref:Aldo/keto reductase family oxidoreductase n=1 Tax=Geojedonia litorea TaxID=1268269 RepID=A0ABV9N5C7_9FLAO
MNYSRIISGTMTWGQWGKNFSKKEMIELMNHCIELGITTFDHADIYGGYTTEADFGKAFSESSIKREAIQLISKCGIQYLCENRNNKIKHYNYSSDYIIWSAETSLKNLKTDYLDLFLLHRPSPLMHPNEVSKAISKLKQDGKIKAFGVSNFTPAQVDLISSQSNIEVNQIECSITQHKAMFDGTLDQMIQKNITPMAWSPLGSIFKDNSEQTQRIKVQLEDLTTAYDATIDQLILAWLLKHPSTIHPVIGTTDKTRISNAVKALNINLDLEDWFLILTASQGHKVP